MWDLHRRINKILNIPKSYKKAFQRDARHDFDKRNRITGNVTPEKEDSEMSQIEQNNNTIQRIDGVELSFENRIIEPTAKNKDAVCEHILHLSKQQVLLAEEKDTERISIRMGTIKTFIEFDKDIEDQLLEQKQKEADAP